MLFPNKTTNLRNHIFINKLSGTSHSFKAPHIFVKYIVRSITNDVYKREKFMSQILNKFEWYPKLLYSDDDKQLLIFMNVGKPVNSTNKPKDLEKQFNQILKDLKSVNVQHNDIKTGEILIDKNKKIYLCDFGWASLNNDLSCGISLWKKGANGDPEWKFSRKDDKTALKRLSLI